MKSMRSSSSKMKYVIYFFTLTMLLVTLQYSAAYPYRSFVRQDMVFSHPQQRQLQDVTVLPDNEISVWERLSEVEEYKPQTYGVYTIDETVDERPILTKFHYFIQPIWWSDVEPQDPSYEINMQDALPVLERVKEYYKEMSFGKFELEWTILEQAVLPGISSVRPDFYDTEMAANMLLESKGYSSGVDYDGIMLIYLTAKDGPFSGAGGWGNVNGPFLWMSFDSEGIDYAVTRHEIGHNFGHEHHLSNKYWYREYRPSVPADGWYDGFDMMSLGNGYEISHFSLASKWYFNWIPNSAIIMMRPEGATDQCRNCYNKGTFTLKPFDDSTNSPFLNDDVMGIHIPISAATINGGIGYFSYWLSYRSGVEGKAAEGLSIHLTWLYNLGGSFGASFDSLNYDAFGNTDNTFDSFVVEGSCYHISPSSKMKDYDYDAAEEIQPVVCVDSVNAGSDITISVEFINNNDLPSAQMNIEEFDLQCSLSGETFPKTLLDAKQNNLVHISGTGEGGIITLSDLCPDTNNEIGSMTAYFYDSYPYSPIAYLSPPAYGSFQSITYKSQDCCQPGSKIPSAGGSIVKITQAEEDFLHLAEIEIYDDNGNNVALEATCYSRTTGYGGDPSCLNDGNTSPSFCGSHSSWMDPDNYDYCVLDVPTAITSVRVYPYHDPGKEWMVDRLGNLRVDIFDSIRKENGLVSFVGLLETHEIGFSQFNMNPSQHEVNLASEIPCPNTSDSRPSLKYQSEYGNTWILLVQETGSFGKFSIGLSCTLENCRLNQYLQDGKCFQCPEITESKSKSANDSCSLCPDGTYLAHPFSNNCYVSYEIERVTKAIGWRIWAADFQTEQQWLLDIDLLEFYDNIDCLGDPINPTLGMTIASGDAGFGWDADNAFDSYSGSQWGGRPDLNGIFWIGKLYDSLVTVRCVRIESVLDKGLAEVHIQANNGEKWINAWVQNDLFGDIGAEIRLDYDQLISVGTQNPTAIEIVPSANPISSPTSAPTASPNSSPTTAPTASPTANPNADPTMVPTMVQSMVPTMQEGESSFCFSANSIVMVKNRGNISMKQLKIGDQVLVSGSKFEPVYSFGHYHPYITAHYLRFRIESHTTTVLTISNDHMIFIADGSSIPASSVCIGTKLLLGNGDLGIVRSIKEVIEKGAYAPFTPSGTIVVNGVLSSTFISFDGKHSLALAGGLVMISFQQIAHLYESMHRIVYRLFGDWCQQETYNENGISSWNAMPLHLSKWLLRQQNSLITMIMVPLLVFATMVRFLEIIIDVSSDTIFRLGPSEILAPSLLIAFFFVFKLFLGIKISRRKKINF